MHKDESGKSDRVKHIRNSDTGKDKHNKIIRRKVKSHIRNTELDLIEKRPFE